MRQKYLQDQTLDNTDATWTPYTYHTLRGLQVAFDVERDAYHHKSTAVPQPSDLIHPLVARALREPLFAWYFFRLLAFKAIDRTKNDEWRITDYDEHGDLLLTNEADGISRGDLVVAMSRLCVQQREHADVIRPITVKGLESRYDRALQQASLAGSSDGEAAHLKQFADQLDKWLAADDRGAVIDKERRQPELLRNGVAKAGRYLLRVEKRLVLG
jgi:hypothetical protein